MSVTSLPISEIRHRPDARPRSDDALASLSESMEAIGLINPIRVRRRGDSYEVVAGSHRLQAADLLGWSEIPCMIVSDDDVQAEMAMIAENLHRAELTKLERDEQVARWIELSRRPSLGVSSQLETKPLGGRPEGGIRAASRELGIDKQDAHRAVKIASLSDEAKAMARNVGLDDNRSALLEAARHTEPAEQVAALRRRHDQHQQPRGGIAGRHAPTGNASPAPNSSETFERFLKACDVIDGMEPQALISSSGRQRAVLGQRASSLADHLNQIVEGLNR